MSSPCACCGCVLQADYGTSTVTGDGSHETPFVVEVVDPTFVRPSVRITDTESVPANTPTVISFSTEVFDTANMWTVGTPTSIIMPYAGIYMMGASASLAVTASLGITMELLKNGSAIHTHIWSSGNSGFTVEGNTSYVFYFNAADTLQLRITHAHSLGAQNVACILWACYLGRGPV